MSADWTTCRVVRDDDGRLWGRDSWTTDACLRRWVQVGTEREVDGCYEGDMARRYGPLTPVLDADGLPVVTTVGDLTARHIGKRVRVEGCEYTLDHIGPGKCLFILGPGGYFPGQQFPLDTPCEVLP